MEPFYLMPGQENSLRMRTVCPKSAHCSLNGALFRCVSRRRSRAPVRGLAGGSGPLLHQLKMHSLLLSGISCKRISRSAKEFFYMMNGILRIQTSSAPQSACGGADHRQRLHGSPHHRCRGQCRVDSHLCPGLRLSPDENNTTTLLPAPQPDLPESRATAPSASRASRIFAGRSRLARPEMIPTPRRKRHRQPAR